MYDNNFEEKNDLAYEKLIDLLIKVKSDELIQNENYDHARILIRSLISKVKPDKFIGVFSGCFNPKGYGLQETINAFQNKLSDGIKLKVLYQKQPTKSDIIDNPFVKQILLNPENEKLIETRKLLTCYSQYDNHILTVNDKAFRLEYGHSETKAIAAFFNDKGKEVREVFNTLFSDIYSEEMSLCNVV